MVAVQNCVDTKTGRGAYLKDNNRGFPRESPSSVAHVATCNSGQTSSQALVAELYSNT